MKVNITDLKKMIAEAKPFSFTAFTQEIFSEFANEDGFFWRDGQAIVEGAAVNKGQMIEVSGVVKVAVKCPCSLCLEETLLELNIPFCQEYQEREKSGNICQSQDEPDLELNYYVGDEIDLEPFVKETLLLSQPLRQVCRKNCRGLCPECGVNLNTTDCGCANKKIDVRMSVLEKLLNNDKNS